MRRRNPWAEAERIREEAEGRMARRRRPQTLSRTLLGASRFCRPLDRHFGTVGGGGVITSTSWLAEGDNGVRRHAATRLESPSNRYAFPPQLSSGKMPAGLRVRLSSDLRYASNGLRDTERSQADSKVRGLTWTRCCAKRRRTLAEVRRSTPDRPRSSHAQRKSFPHVSEVRRSLFHTVSLGSHHGKARRDPCQHSRVAAALRLAHANRSRSDHSSSYLLAGDFSPCPSRPHISDLQESFFMKMTPLISGALAALIFFPAGASANNVGENVAWQFDTSADKVNKAYLEEMRQKRRNGYYSAPVYNTYIDRQYNCSVSASAVGNSSSSNAVANSPSTSGHSSAATGNNNSTTTSSGYGSGSGSISGEQQNSGAVTADTSGDQSTSVRGDNHQALNTVQTNSGDQTASVSGSTACQYGALN